MPILRRAPHPKIDGRWFEVDGVAYGVSNDGPRWGWAIHSSSGATIADGYDTLRELLADAERAVQEHDDDKAMGGGPLARTQRPTGAAQHDARVAELVDLGEHAVSACLEVLPLEGSWGEGYHVSSLVQSEIRALPEEWATAAHAVAALQRSLSEVTSSEL